MRHYIATLIFDLILLAPIYFWQAQGMEGAKNLVLFQLWFLVVIGWIAIVSYVQGKKDATPEMPLVLKAWARIKMLGVICLLVWSGMFVLPGFLAFNMFMLFAITLDKKKAKP